MYNRYLSDEAESYIPAQERPARAEPESPPHGNAGNSQPPPDPHHGPPPGGSPMDRIQQLLGFGGKRESSEGTPLRRLLARFHLEDVDTGDLLLLILLFFLLEEKADDELLIALGLLLIL